MYQYGYILPYYNMYQPNIMIEFSERKTVQLKVAGNIVFVKAPYGSSRFVKEILRKKSSWISQQLSRQASYGNSNRNLLAARSTNYSREEIKAIIHESVLNWSDIMCVKASNIKVSSARTRWGSCSGKNSISINWRLTLLDRQLLDYVVIHELAHIVFKNHSKSFWSLVAQYCPNYKKHRVQLKALSHVMKIDFDDTI